MEEQLDQAPCGYLTISEEGIIRSINYTLLELLGYQMDDLIGKSINHVLTTPASIFYQFYFVPLIKKRQQVEEMYISLKSINGEEIPVLLNAIQRNERNVIECVLVKMQKRDEYEDELLIAKKETESALAAKHEANKKLEIALEKLENRQNELIKINKENQKYKTETKKELHLAKSIQESLLPTLMVSENIQMDAFYNASKELSGDMYGFYQISSTQYSVILLDVMGHGVSSAMITVSLQSLFQRLMSRETQPEVIIKELDNHLHALFDKNEEFSHYCTAIYLFIDTQRKTIKYINAGHPPVLWQDSEGVVNELLATGPPIGSFLGLSFSSETIYYKDGDRLLLYTDGVVDPYDSHLLFSIMKEYRLEELPMLKEKLLQLNNDVSTPENDDQCFILIDFKNRDEC